MHYSKKLLSGHVEPRKNSKGDITHYRAVIYLGRDNNGKQIKPYRKAATKEEAEALLIQMKAEYLNDEFIHPSEMKVSEYLEEWFSAYILNQRSESTVFDYREILNRYIIPYWGNVKLQSLDTMKIQKTFNLWSQKSPFSNKPLSIESLKHIKRVFNTAMNKAIELEYIKRNPLKGVSINTSVCKNEIEVFTQDEISRLFTSVKNTDMELIVALLLDSLARRAEILGARWSDINLDTGEFIIRNTSIRTLEGTKFKEGTKTKSSNRSMYLTEYTIKLLKKEQRQQKINKLKYGSAYHDNNLIICKKDGTPYKVNSLTQKWKRTLKKHDIRHIKLHGTRHSAITHMIASGISPKEVQDRAGHKSIDITMNIYTHIDKDQKRATTNAINNSLFKSVINA